MVTQSQSVYNLEVHGHHIYQVIELGVLVHNAGIGSYHKVRGHYIYSKKAFEGSSG